MREGSPPLGQQVTDWLEYLTFEGRSPATIKIYGHFVRQGDYRDVIRKYLPVLKSAQTCWCAFKAFNRWQVQEGYAEPLRLPSPKGHERPPKPFLTADQVKAVYRLAGGMDGKVWAPNMGDQERPATCASNDHISPCPPASYQLMIRLLLTGLRVSEMCNARQSDLRGDKLTVRGKTGYRTIVLDQETLEMLGKARDTAEAMPLAEPLERRPHLAPIIQLTPNACRARLAKMGRDLRIPGLTPHVFRRTMASQAMLAGMDTRHIRTLGGWNGEGAFQRRYVFYVLEGAALDASRSLNLTTELLGDQ